MSGLHDARLRAAPLLEAALGVRSVIERFDSLLAQFAPPTLDLSDRAGDAWTELVLGAISIRNQLATLIEQRSAPDVDHTRTPVPREGLLR